MRATRIVCGCAFRYLRHLTQWAARPDGADTGQDKMDSAITGSLAVLAPGIPLTSIPFSFTSVGSRPSPQVNSTDRSNTARHRPGRLGDEVPATCHAMP